MAAGERQRSQLRYHNGRGIVQGIFYGDGRRRYIKLATYAELGLDAQGNSRNATERARNARTLDRLYAAKRAALQQQAPPGGATLLTAYDEWMRTEGAGKAERTRYYYRRTRETLAAAAIDPPLAQFRRHHADQFRLALREAGLGAVSINIRLENLRTFLRWAHECELLDRIPRIAAEPEHSRLPHVFSETDVARWLAYLRGIRRWRQGRPGIPRDGLAPYFPGRHQRRSAHLRERAIRLLLDTGLRLGELMACRWADFTLDGPRPVLRVRFTKERQDKEIPLTGSLTRYLRACRRCWPREQWLLDDGKGGPAYAGGDSFTTQLQRDLRILGLAGRGVKVVHGFRALFAARLRDRGVPIDVIADLMGHRQLTTTRGYLPATDVPHRAAIALLEAPPPRQGADKTADMPPAPHTLN